MGSTIPRNAFVIHCGPPAAESDDHDFGSVTLRERPMSQAGTIDRFDRDGVTIWVRGHLYCRNARSFDVVENLGVLANALREKSSLADAMTVVAGGLFAVIVIDRSRGVLEAATDRLGCMPLYFRQSVEGIDFTNNPFVFQGDTPLAETAVCEYLKYGHLPFSDSLFEGVRRVGPGETVTVTLGPNPRLAVDSRRYRTYLPIAERVQTPAEGAERLADAFDAYFARLGSGRGIAGLSGGYDSRLIAAYTANHDVSLFNFGNPRSREVRFAQRVAGRVGKTLDCFQIRTDAVARHGARLREVMPGLDSFENAHVFELADRVAASDSSYCLDGFGGDSVIGSNYYYKLGGGHGGLLGNLLMRDRFESHLHEPQYYADLLYKNKRAVPDDALDGLIGADIRSAIHSRILMLESKHREWCPTHEDMVESLTHATRGRCLIAGGPVALSAFTVCYCPFVDHDVFDAAMACAKHVRAGDRLYNALWRRRFPELADVPKMNTGGRPHDNDRAYRAKHLATAVMQRGVNPRLKRLTFGWWDRTEEYSSPTAYMADPSNRDFLRSLAERSMERLPLRVVHALSQDYTAERLNPLVHLRMGSLLSYLG